MEILVKVRSLVLVCSIAVALPVIVHLSKQYFYPFVPNEISEPEALKILEKKIEILHQQLNDQREAFKDEELKLLAYKQGKMDFEEKMGAIKTTKQELKTLQTQASELRRPFNEQYRQNNAQNYKAQQNHYLKLFIVDMIIALLLIILTLLLPHALLQAALMTGALIITLNAYTQAWSNLSTGVLLLTVLAWFGLLIFLVIRFYEKSVSKS